MAQDKKVEQITSMEDDFAQWYTDICKKAELIDYSSVKGFMILLSLIHIYFYYLKDGAEDVLIDEEDCADDATNDFVICSVCGAISTEADTKFKPLCEHSESNYRKLRKIEQHKNHVARCPACGFGSFRHFYLGSEAATAVLGTELFEQLPNEMCIRDSRPRFRNGLAA